MTSIVGGFQVSCGIAGDITLGGTKINEAEGHYNDKWKPQGFDTRQIFLSPSMKYAGLQVYAKKQQ
jgi:hypothetical protein